VPDELCPSKVWGQQHQNACGPMAGGAAIHRELKSRKNVALQLLWEEYKQANPLGYAYSWCELDRNWKRRLDVVMFPVRGSGFHPAGSPAGNNVRFTVIDSKTRGDPRVGEEPALIQT
jgi:transposase